MIWGVDKLISKQVDKLISKQVDKLIVAIIMSFVKFVVVNGHIIKVNVQTSMFKGKKVHIIKFKAQCSKFKV